MPQRLMQLDRDEFAETSSPVDAFADTVLQSPALVTVSDVRSDVRSDVIPEVVPETPADPTPSPERVPPQGHGRAVDSSQLAGVVNTFDLARTGDDDSAAAPRVQHRVPLRFTGTGFGYFGAWAVNGLLMLLTLGLYHPWAQVRRLHYLHRHTLIDGHALVFHGEPRQRLPISLLTAGVFVGLGVGLWISPLTGLLALVLAAGAVPVLCQTAWRWEVLNTRWRGRSVNLRGNVAELLGIGAASALWAAALVVPAFVTLWSLAATGDLPLLAVVEAWPPLARWALAVASLWLLLQALPLPYAACRVHKLLWSRTGNSQLRFESELRLSSLWGLNLKNGVLLLLTLGLYAPFAQMAQARLRLQSVTLVSRVELDELVAQQPR